MRHFAAAFCGRNALADNNIQSFHSTPHILVFSLHCSPVTLPIYELLPLLIAEGDKQLQAFS